MLGHVLVLHRGSVYAAAVRPCVRCRCALRYVAAACCALQCCVTVWCCCGPVLVQLRCSAYAVRASTADACVSCVGCFLTL